jgi:hypothetical protein
VTTLSNHVPDPRLITAFAEQRDGPLHRVNPWTKVGIVGALVLAVTVADRLALLPGLYGAVLVVYGLAGLPYRRLAGWYTLPMLFIVSVAGPLAFLEPGTPVGGALSTPLGELSVTWEGLVLFAELSCRSLTVVTFALTASMTTVSDRQLSSAKRTRPAHVTERSPSGVGSAPPTGVPGSRNASGPATETMNSIGSVYQPASRRSGSPASP